MIATGRAAHTVFETAKALALPYDIPLVCSNGAKGLFLTPELEIRPIFSTPVPLDVTLKVIQISREMDLVIQYYYNENIYANPSNPEHFGFTQRYSELTGSQTIYLESHEDMKALAKDGLPSKLLVFCSTEKMSDIYSELENRLQRKAHLIKGTPGGWFIEVLHPDVCKGHGLLRMCNHLQIPPEKCLSFGDGDNDKEFLEWSGHGIAMKNARELVKQVADETIEFSNDEDGVLRTLRRMDQAGSFHFDD